MFSSTSYALSLDDIPFIGGQPASAIVLSSANKTLQKTLEAELKIQREQNRQLKLYKTPSKIAFFERQLLTKRLRAEGYYNSALSSDIDDDGAITHRVNAGPLYTISNLTLNLPQEVTIPETMLPAEGSALIAQNVLDLRSQLESYIGQQYCFYKVGVDYQAEVYHADHTASLEFSMRDSASTTFGDVTITGNKTVDPDYLLDRLDLKPGACFRRTALDSARLTLLKTNLLASVSIQEGVNSANGVPIELQVKERNHRSVSFGVGYRADEGAGVLTGWEHRNLWGRAELATVDLYLAQRRQALDAKLTIPDFYRDDQTLTLFSELEKQDTDAYQSKVASIGALVSRKFGRYLRADVGAQMDFSRIEEGEQLEDYALLSLPLQLEYDRRSAPLDPRFGYVIGLGAQPFWDVYETSTTFLKNSIAASFYHTFNNTMFTPTMAVRGALGSITGADRQAIPANERFYVGGGGSVRGYPFQTLGPMTDNEPDGGLSYNEVSVEARLHFGQSWGAVVFLDGGYAYEEEVPTIGEDLLWGAGIGMRYYTSFAPIRFDIGVPLDKRDDIDDAFQIYISIGQAF
ncbi:autotransporter assembly complex protein TamA [Halioxenophilus aromaticivorans]|uniref:Autotransporter assembly complex family protein n=1 Tax=Halioxenophilus aromaticivorans TaxID=1306992 RepID=A0AAV3TY45_9ALTE